MATAVQRHRDDEPLVFDREAFDRAAERGGPPTTDDVTILADGTRLDTPDKMRKFVAEILLERAGVAEAPDPTMFESEDRFATWLAEFTGTHPALA